MALPNLSRVSAIAVPPHNEFCSCRNLAPPPLRRQVNNGWFYFPSLSDVDLQAYISILCAAYHAVHSPAYQALPIKLREMLVMIRNHLPAVRMELNSEWTHAGFSNFPNLQQTNTEFVVQLDDGMFYLSCMLRMPNLRHVMPTVNQAGSSCSEIGHHEPTWIVMIPVDSFMQLDLRTIPRVSPMF